MSIAGRKNQRIFRPARTSSYCRFLLYCRRMNTNLKKQTPAKRLFMLKTKVRRTVLIVIGSCLMALNLNTFVHAGGLFPGGFNGLTVLIQSIGRKFLQLDIPYTPVNLALNAIPAVISFLYIGKNFTLFSVLSIFLTGVFTDVFPTIKLTNDILLLAVFGGGLNAIAIYFCLLAPVLAGFLVARIAAAGAEFRVAFRFMVADGFPVPAFDGLSVFSELMVGIPESLARAISAEPIQRFLFPVCLHIGCTRSNAFFYVPVQQ